MTDDHLAGVGVQGKEGALEGLACEVLPAARRALFGNNAMSEIVSVEPVTFVGNSRL